MQWSPGMTIIIYGLYLCIFILSEYFGLPFPPHKSLNLRFRYREADCQKAEGTFSTLLANLKASLFIFYCLCYYSFGLLVSYIFLFPYLAVSIF